MVILYSGTTSYGPSYAYLDKLADKVCQMASSPQTFINFEVNKDYKAYKDNKGYKAYKGSKAYRGYKDTRAHKA